MPRLPKLPRRRPRWQRAARSAARKTGWLAAWFAIGFASMAAADTVPGGSTLWPVVFFTVFAVGWFVIRRGPRVVRTIRYSRTPKRHRRNPSSKSQTHNLSIRGLTSALTRRIRRG